MIEGVRDELGRHDKILTGHQNVLRGQQGLIVGFADDAARTDAHIFLLWGAIVILVLALFAVALTMKSELSYVRAAQERLMTMVAYQDRLIAGMGVKVAEDRNAWARAYVANDTRVKP